MKAVMDDIDNQDSIKTFEDLNKLVARLCELRREKKDLADTVSNLQGDIDQLELLVLDTLEKAEIPSYRSPDALVSTSVRRSYKTPKTVEEKQAFFEYYKAQGFDDGQDPETAGWEILGVNSAKLNSWCKAELERREEENDFGVEFPGLGEPSEVTKLSVRTK